MGERRAAGVVLAWVTSHGCVADGRDDSMDLGHSAATGPGAALGPRAGPAIRRCDGAVLPACDEATCTLDETQCSMPGLDTTAGTTTPEGSTTRGDAEMVMDTDPAATSDGTDGCDCRAGASGEVWAALFWLPLLGASRRRRAA